MRRPGVGGGERDAAQQNQLLLDALAAHASRGQAVALLIDDAHHLRIGALRRLWDFVEASAVVPEQRLPIVLAGLPEIEGKLRQPELRPLQAAIQIRRRLERLNEVETGFFIAHQLKAAGHASGDLLSPAVVERMIHHSQGIPRAIAKLCDTVLLFASLQAEREITPAMVDEAAQSCFFGDRAELPKPVDWEPPIASAAITPPPVVEVRRRRWPRGFWVNGLTLAALTVAAIIGLWPSKPVPEEKPPPPNSLGQWEALADPPAASSPVSVRSPVPAATPPVVPALDSPESGTPASESGPVLPIENVAAPLTPNPVSSTQPQAAPEIKPQVTRSPVNKTRPQRPGAAQPSSPTTGQQASRIQSQPRVAKPRTVVKSRTTAKARRGWAPSTVRYPWEPPAPTGFNQK